MSKKNPSGVPEQDIIELTDVIEDAGSPAGDAKAQAEGMDMGFQQELDDLFAEGGVVGDAKAQAVPVDPAASAQAPDDDLDLTNLEAGADFDLRLPEEESAHSAGTLASPDAGGIDVAGLDALLDEGKISLDEPIVPIADDELSFSEQAAPGHVPAGESGGLDDLDSLLAGTELGPEPDEEMPMDGLRDEELIDLDSLMADSGLDEGYTPGAEDCAQTQEPSPAAVTERLAAIEAKLEQIGAAQHLAVMDLADSLKMATTPAIDLEALTASLEPVIERLLASETLIERAQEIFEERVAALEDTLSGSLAALVEKLLDERLAALTQSLDSAAAPDMTEALAGVTAAVDETLKTGLTGLRDELTTAMRQLAPDTQAMKEELSAAIDQAVPAAAAKIIREEIAALAKELD